jgi:cell division protein FtsL
MIKTRTSSRVGPALLMLFLLPALVYAAYSVGDRWYQAYILAQEEADLRREIAELRSENVNLQAELTRARSDESLETVAREQLGLVKPGDRAIVLIGPRGATPEAAAPEPGDPVPEKPAWRKLLDAVFRR